MHRPLSTLALTLALGLVPTVLDVSPCPGEDGNMPTHYYLSVSSTHVILSIGLNDVPIVEDAGGGVTTTEPVNLWLKPEGNRLTVKLGWPGEEEFETGRSKLQAQLFIHDPTEDTPTPAEVLAEFSWPVQVEEGEDPVEEILPHSHDEVIEAEIAAPPPLMLWSEAEILPGITEVDQQAILDLVEELRSAMMAKDTDRAFELMRYRYEEEARAEGKDFDAVREAVVKTWEWMLGMDGELVSTTLLPENANLTLVADGQVVFVDRSDAEDAVAMENEEAEMGFGIPVFAARIGGQWRIVR